MRCLLCLVAGFAAGLCVPVLRRWRDDISQADYDRVFASVDEDDDRVFASLDEDDDTVVLLRDPSRPTWPPRGNARARWPESR